jgi:phosphatidylinositol glycan class B
MIYYLVDKPMELMGFFPQFRAYVLSCLPNVAQGIFAAFSDYYTWKLSQKIYGLGSGPTWAAVSNKFLIV